MYIILFAEFSQFCPVSRLNFPVAVLAQFQWSPGLGQWPVSSSGEHLLFSVCQCAGNLHLLHAAGQETEAQHGGLGWVKGGGSDFRVDWIGGSGDWIEGAERLGYALSSDF